MITRNKLASGSGKDWGKKSSKNRRLFVLLPLLLIVVAGATFGIIWLLKSSGILNTSTDRPAETIPEPALDTVPANENPVDENGQTIDQGTASIQPITSAPSTNPTIVYGRLMLINPNYRVETDFINARKGELISLQTTYGIVEMNSGNGDNLLDKEAAEHLNQMLDDYSASNPGHSMQTVSCFRSVGTNCGRLCAATGESDHHTGLTCDLIDPVYGTSLDTDAYNQHVEWQWLKQNSYKYGFIDRFPEAWAGGPMSAPANVDANGSTGLFETWHYRYVGVYAATEIASGLYNNGEYDSLEHYLLARNLLTDLLNRQ